MPLAQVNSNAGLQYVIIRGKGGGAVLAPRAIDGGPISPRHSYTRTRAAEPVSFATACTLLG